MLETELLNSVRTAVQEAKQKLQILRTAEEYVIADLNRKPHEKGQNTMSADDEPDWDTEPETVTEMFRRMNWKPHEKRATLLLRDIPKHLKDQFKAWCAAHSISMTAQLVKMMQELIDPDSSK